MIKIIMLVAACVVGCSGGESAQKADGVLSNSVVCKTPLVGHWVEASIGASLNFYTDRAFSFSDEACQGIGSYNCPGDTNSGTLIMNVSRSTNTPNCLSVGSYNCQYTIAGNNVVYNCGGTSGNFVRKD